ncbi:hypothetical protein [Amycolatopsis pigmentata]|uniref:Uncharacterized protein n=1 Tax=Amycolatopsis pigmentata TaxID=450801 RepID=A0ABW5FXV5_9PSEU
MRVIRKIALATIAAGIVVGSLSGGTALASTSTTAHPMCGTAICWE